MAGTDIEIAYRPVGIVLLRRVLLFFSPLWGIGGPLMAIFFLLKALFCPPFELISLSTGCATFFLSALAALAFVAVRKPRIKLSAYGIEVPAFCVNHWNLMKTRQPWSKLLSAIVIDKDDATRAKIVLQFENGARLQISARDLDAWESKKFMPALAEIANSDAIGKLCDELSLRRLSDRTFQMDIPYVRNFGTTSFVPLDTGAKLQSNRIEVVQQLVSGGLSAVYLVKLESSEKAILKESNVPDTADDAYKQKALQLFDREAMLLSKLQHDRIAKVYDHFVENGRHYILLELIRGRDLRRVVKTDGPAPQECLWQWALQVAQTLEYLHLQDPPIIHRDLTPDNLVLRNGSEIVVIDFGAANEFLGTATGTLVGKQAYISPEQFRGKATNASDVYSLGCTLHYLSTGIDPTPLTQSRPRSHNSNLDILFDDLVAACTEQDEKLRPKTHELADLITGALKCKTIAPS